FDRTADSAAKLVAMVRRLGQSRSPIIGVELVISHELKNRTVKLVGAGLSDHVDDAAGIPSILCVVAVSLDLEFLNRIRIGQNITGVPQVGHVDAAVQKVVY